MFQVWNETDGLPASPSGFKTRAAAEKFERGFRRRLQFQGYYLTSFGGRIPIDQVRFVILETKK